MKNAAFLLALGLTASPASGQQPMKPELSGTRTNHQLSWLTTPNHFYSVDCSPDLKTWIWTGIEEPGNGGATAYNFSASPRKLFYRIRETKDPNNGAFLVLPEHNDEFDEVDGVCFAFDLNQFASLPAKILVFEREYDNPSDQWEQIGAITDFDEIDGIRFVRGSAVWLAEVLPGQSETDYKVQATVIDDTGTMIASAIRLVTVGKNQPPVVTITGGPTSPSATAQPAVFTAEAEDPDGDPIRRVEFYDNGILIGTDTTPTPTGNPDIFEFGDDVLDQEGVYYDLLRLDDDPGTPEDESIHHITAKAFDSRGAVGETGTSHPVDITGAGVNARPVIQVTNVPDGRLVVAREPDAFTIDYTVSDPDGLSDITEIEAYDITTSESEDGTATPSGSLTFDTTSWALGTHTLRVVARDQAGDESYPLYLEIDVSSGLAETLAANMVDGSSATVVENSEKFVGVEASSGIFTSGEDSGLEIDSGALLTTGSFSIWNGGDPDTEDGENMGEHLDPNFGVNNIEPGDADLEDRVVGVRTTDAAAIEFDVLCQNGQLQLDYQFGSEEYDEFVGKFNDGFMVTITRPGASSGTVVSLLPDCSDIVAVNTVSQVPDYDDNEHLFLDDDLDIEPNVAPGNEANQVEYDGMTIRLKTHAFVTPDRVYRVKIVIADTDGNDSNDHYYDSGVFVGESSLRTILPAP